MTSRILHPVKSVVDRISARTRIALGQILLLIGVMLLAVTLGIVPNDRQATLAGRSRLCEAVAVYCSIQISHAQSERIAGAIEPMLRRDQGIVAGLLRRADGKVLAQFGTASADDSNIAVPIWANEHQWGALEVHFRPIVSSGVLGLITHPFVRLIGFVSLLCGGLYGFYLRQMLQHLDPSKVVPPRVRSALDTLAEGLIVLDNDHRVVLANRAFAQIVGREPDDLMGVHVSHLPWEGEALLWEGEAPAWEGEAPAEPLPLAASRTKSRPIREAASGKGSSGASPFQIDSQRTHSRPWESVTTNGEAVRGTMMRLRDHHGSLRTFCVNCSPVLGGEGKTRGVLVSLDDVTQLEHNEVELRKSKEEAEHANRAKSEFLARMSHEIRTPMNAILGFADILRRGYEENETERHEYLETIHSSGQHLLELINDILDLSKIESGRLEIEPSLCSPHALICEVVSVLSVRASQKSIGLSFERKGDIPIKIATDPTRFRQALTNLVGNAVKFTETGGVRIVARLIPDKHHSKLSVDVIDSGIGIDPQAMDRIFQPFAQADTSITRRFGGTGLGLSISRQIAEALGGGIIVHSEVGKGTTFTLSIDVGPIADIELAERAPTSSMSPAVQKPAELQASLAGLRILVADDGESNRKLVSLVLARCGAIIETANDGQEACELSQQNRYDLILMDMQMPVMDGYSAATTLRGAGIEVPIIALTAHAMRGDEEKCRAAGCSGFLTKPIDMDLLIRTVSQAAGVGRDVATPLVATEVSIASGPALFSTLPTSDPEFCEIVAEFVERLREQIAAISDAWAKGDLDQLAGLAHWVKGSGGTAGFPALTAPAKDLEQAAREKRLDDIAASISQLRELAGRVSAPSTQVTQLI